MEYFPFCSTEIFFTTKEKMKEKILSFAETDIVLIVNPAFISSWDLEQFIEDMKRKFNLIWIQTDISNPTMQDVQGALKLIGSMNPNTILVLGGGSAIDLAKGISAFYDIDIPSIESISNSIQKQLYRNKKQFIDIIAVPTTSGTGSEITQWATLWDFNKNIKYSIDDSHLKPKAAFIIPELTLTLPSQLTLSSALDAAAHAIEAYWSKYTAPIVQDIAYRALEIITENLKSLLESPADLKLRNRLSRASLLAGLAFSQTKTTACHSISYPLTMLYNVPHGLAAAMTLDAVGKINRGYFPNDDDLFKLFHPHGGIQAWIDDVCSGRLKLRLKSFQIYEKDLPILVEHSFTNGRMDNNPVKLQKMDVTNILMVCL